MIINWIGIRGDRKIDYSQPEKDCIQINNTLYDFSDIAIVDYEIPELAKQYIPEAKRIGGELSITLITCYAKSEKHLWEPSPKVESKDYGIGVISWKE